MHAIEGCEPYLITLPTGIDATTLHEWSRASPLHAFHAYGSKPRMDRSKKQNYSLLMGAVQPQG